MPGLLHNDPFAHPSDPLAERSAPESKLNPYNALGIGLVVAIGLTVYNLSKQPSTPSDTPQRERNR